MKWIPEADERSIREKYTHTPPRDPEKQSGYDRFRCNDAAYDLSTGLTESEMRERLTMLLNEWEGEDHACVKAKCTRFILENTPILLSEGDYFPGIHAISRLSAGLLMGKWNREINEAHDDARRSEELKAQATTCGAALIYYDFDHSVPNFDYILPLGFPGMLENVKKAKTSHDALTEKETAFFDAMVLELEAILAFLDRLISYSDAHPNEKTPAVCAALVSLRRGAPQTVYEVLLFIYLYHIISEYIDGLQVRSLSALDLKLYPYYQSDLRNGITHEEEMTYIAYFLMQYQAQGNYFNQPMLLGGSSPDGASLINPLSHAILDVYRDLGLWNPKIHIKYAANTPRDFMKKALAMVRDGNASFVFVSDETMTEALERIGCSHEDACRAVTTGCYEYSTPEGVTHMGAFVNLAKMLEFALFDGHDMKTGETIGAFFGKSDEFDTFDALFEAFASYTRFEIDLVAECIGKKLPYYAEIWPNPLFSASRERCLAVTEDIYASGAERYFDTMMIGTLATTADSLAMIKKYVYDKKTLTLAELKRCLQSDFADAPLLRQKLLHDPDKYGNGRELPDSIAARIADFAARYVNGRPDGRKNGAWYCGTHVSTRYRQWRSVTGATADGRIRGEELSKNASPVQGMAVSGATASILSATRIDARDMPGDFPLDLALVPASFSGDEGLDAMLSLLDVYRMRHGHAIQFNTVDASVLRAAQKEPEKYKDLQIRVCGWNALFCTMTPNEQEGFIRQAEGAR